jgi:hypothetical protein
MAHDSLREFQHITRTPPGHDGGLRAGLDFSGRVVSCGRTMLTGIHATELSYLLLKEGRVQSFSRNRLRRKLGVSAHQHLQSPNCWKP